MTESNPANGPDSGDTDGAHTCRLGADTEGSCSVTSDDEKQTACGHNVSTATRYWMAHTWVEVLPDGTCFITQYDGELLDTGQVAPETEAVLGTVAMAVDWTVPIAKTRAWTRPDRTLPALDKRDHLRDTLHRTTRSPAQPPRKADSESTACRWIADGWSPGIDQEEESDGD